MESSKKLFSAIVGAGIMGAGTIAIAQPGPGGCDGRGPAMMGAKFDPAARVDTRLTRPKADLKITAEQEPLWQAFAEKAKAEAGQGLQTMRDQAQNQNLSAPDRMARMAELLKQRAAALESVNDSFKRLYGSLSDEQKQIADRSMSRWGAAGPRGGRGAWRHS